jgi:hypothetical protein
MTVTTELTEGEVRDRAARFGLNVYETTKLNFVVGGGGRMAMTVHPGDRDSLTAMQFLRALVSAGLAVAGV